MTGVQTCALPIYYPVVQNGILLIACLVILVNFVVDVLYGFANPRIRHQR